MIYDEQVKELSSVGLRILIVAVIIGFSILFGAEPIGDWMNGDAKDIEAAKIIAGLFIGLGLGIYLVTGSVVDASLKNCRKAKEKEMEQKMQSLEAEIAELKGGNNEQ